MSQTRLDDRILRERDFHDAFARGTRVEDIDVRGIFESPGSVDNGYVRSRLGDLNGQRVLDLGCGMGESSVFLALQGARVSACDISGEMIQKARELAALHGVRIEAVEAPSDRLPFADGTFDVVYGNGILHHVDLLPTAEEVRRVMKPGARGFFIEPLPYNPAINLYRRLARGTRTEDERPLRLRDVRAFGSRFSSVRTEAFWFFSLLIFFHFFFVKRWHPGRVRYWKKIIEAGEEYRGMIAFLNRVDRSVFKVLPFLKVFSWNIVIEVKK